MVLMSRLFVEGRREGAAWGRLAMERLNGGDWLVAEIYGLSWQKERIWWTNWHWRPEHRRSRVNELHKAIIRKNDPYCRSGPLVNFVHKAFYLPDVHLNLH